MAYCRFVPGSDVYMYSDISGGWTVHVASKREIKGQKVKTWNGIRIPGGPLPKMRKIKNKRAGSSRNVKTREEMISLLLQLKKEKLRVPRIAIDRLLNEIYH